MASINSIEILEILAGGWQVLRVPDLYDPGGEVLGLRGREPPVASEARHRPLRN